MTETQSEEMVPKSTQNIYGNRDHLLDLLRQADPAVFRIGLNDPNLITVARALFTPSDIGVDNGNLLSLIVAAHFTTVETFNRCQELGIDVVFENYNIEQAVDNAIETLSFFSIQVTDEEREGLLNAIALIPYQAMKNYQDSGMLDGQVIFQTNSDGIVMIDGIVIADRQPGAQADASYTLNGNSLTCQASDSVWQRKIAHEIVHALRLARAGELGSFDEAYATIIEFFSTLSHDKKVEYLSKLQQIDQLSEMDTLLLKIKLNSSSTIKFVPHVLKLVELAQKTGQDLKQMFSDYLKPVSS